MVYDSSVDLLCHNRNPHVQSGIEYECIGVSTSENEVAKTFSDEEKQLLPYLECRLLTIRMMFDNPKGFPSLFFGRDLSLAKNIAIYELNRIMSCVSNIISRHKEVENYDEVQKFKSEFSVSCVDESEIHDYSGVITSAVICIEEMAGVMHMISDSTRSKIRLESFKRQYEFLTKYTAITQNFEDVYIVAGAILTFIKEIETQKSLDLEVELRETLEGIEMMYMMLIGNSQSSVSVEIRKFLGASVLVLLSITTSTGTFFDNMQADCPHEFNLSTAKDFAINAVETVKKLARIPSVKLPNGITL
jgi:hypothetical protein